MKGYKAFDKDLKCRGMQYEIGGTYELGYTPVCCQRGFHFCKKISDCYSFYERTDETRICEVEALGDVVTDERKYCTNKIHIIREVENPRMKTNANETSTGYCNSGNFNTGDRNTGDYNSGSYNDGNWNSGNGNTGSHNSGNCNNGGRNTGNNNNGVFNAGHWNSGNFNTGNYNSGDYNTGNFNSGSRNTGDKNSGIRNSGYMNGGNRNSGDYNSGNGNCGNFNSGNYNHGAWNSGNGNTGAFNTEKKSTIKLFDKDSNWTMKDLYKSKAYHVMENYPVSHSDFIIDDIMSEEEKENHPEYKNLGGYTKTITVKEEDRQEWWDNLPDSDKQEVMSLPNFDADKFYLCTGIRVKDSNIDI